MKPDFEKFADGLVPAVIQDATTGKVLMLGYMNAEALEQTKVSGKVTFFSRSKNRLWIKGETSGNFLLLQEILLDCDKDCLLVKVKPAGPVCHTGNDTCFNENNVSETFINQLEAIISVRKQSNDTSSYTSSLFQKGINKIAQKVGEEAVELVIEAKDNNDDLFVNEAADLMYHYLVLLHAKGFTFSDVLQVLQERHNVKVSK